MAKIVKLRFSGGGNVKEETEGFFGTECLKTTEALRNRLGMAGAEIQAKEEMFMSIENPDTLVTTGNGD